MKAILKAKVIIRTIFMSHLLHIKNIVFISNIFDNIRYNNIVIMYNRCMY